MTDRAEGLEWAVSVAPIFLSEFVARLPSAEAYHGIAVSSDGSEDDAALTPLPQLDTERIGLAQTFKRFESASAEAATRFVMSMPRALNRDEDGNFPVWIMGIDRTPNERFVLTTAIADTEDGPKVLKAEPMDAATLEEILDSSHFPVGGVPKSPHQRRDTEGLSEGDAIAYVETRLEHITSDALERIVPWALAEPAASGVDLEDMLTIDRGDKWGHEDLPPPARADMSLSERLDQLREYMREVDSPTTLARFRHAGSNYLLALYHDKRLERGALVRVEIGDEVATEFISLADAS